MAEENARPSRGRKKDVTTDPAGSVDRKKKATAAKKAAPAKAKATTKKTTTRSRKPKLVVEPTRDAIAEHAYLLWERGEPGDETQHWLRAEAELRAA
jgi:hypothetical protein